ncbi:MAG: type II secretion system protein [Geobacteraceae bacterium]|nr:type II secretion system protein [Geobacteraceae bacterium]
MSKALLNRRGLSLIELVVTVAILSILASLAIPLAQNTARRMKEAELRRNLRVLRTAIDDFKKTYDKAVTEGKIPSTLDKSGYPENLKQLVEGYDFGGLYKTKKKFLRKVPVDPFNPPKDGEDPGWGLRSYADEPGSDIWGGEDLFDVYSLSKEKAIDGTFYKDW